MKKISFLKDSWLLLPVFPYLMISWQHSQNLPIMDDFDVILGTVIKWKRGDYVVLFEQYNEHRILWSRIVYVLYYSIFGDINFKTLLLFGNLQMIVSSGILVYFIKQSGVKFWQLPALMGVFLLADLNTFESGSIAMYAWQNNGIVMLFMLCLCFWSKGKVMLAVAIQALMIFSSGNGMIGALCIVVYTFFRERKLFYWSLSSFLVLTPLYFVGYRFVQQPTAFPFDINIATEYFIKQAGAPFSFDNAMYYGVVVISSALFLIPWKCLNKHMAILSILAFSLLTMITNAVFRSCMTDAQYQGSRYLIYPQIVISLLLYFAFIKSKKWGIVGVCVSILWLFIYYPYNYWFGELGFERTENRVTTRKYWHSQPEMAEQIAKDAAAEGIYNIEDNR